MSGSGSTPATPDEVRSDSDLDGPVSPGYESSEASTPLDEISDPSPDPSLDKPKRMPSLRSVSEPHHNMNPNSTPHGVLGRARNPVPVGSPFAAGAAAAMDNSVMARARALHQHRLQKGMMPTSSSPTSPAPGGPMAGHNGFPGTLRMPPNLHRPGPVPHANSAPSAPGQSLSQRRANKLGMGMKLPDMGGASSSPGSFKLSDITGSKPGEPGANGSSGQGSKLDDYKQYIDAEKGWITFDGAATITRTGVNFANGQTFSISLDEVEKLDELGKGNYGTVYKVRHAKPAVPRFGQGFSGSRLTQRPSDASQGSAADDANGADGTTGKVMAMKEIRLELDDAKFTTILKELVILHECVSPYIIDFYGAFFQEGAVYICIEYMDGGSIDKLYDGGIPESILRKITYSTVMGLKTLKDDHNIIHRDVKPTNVLVNTRGQIKICDFGVSGNLVASIAKTNIGCQSYMAPERISGGGMAQSGNADGTYSVQSDVWSLGLTIIECAMGRYPYPPEVSSTIFSQLNAIVEGDPPDLPSEGFSDAARDFVRSCLHKIPKKRPTYAMLLQHPWLKPFSKPQTITEEAEEGEEAEQVAEAVGKIQLGGGTEDDEVADWVKGVLRRKQEGMGTNGPTRPALHAAPLDSVSPLGSPLLQKPAGGL
ncbi:Mitogen-activated protein kinase kinase [Purpureocillium takamizusanense]|uniref:mitogen-activated protein kinase kinase n=1 Tax=Purpureocillium takamizusanense TaxID=2060973 RepID=A0A9Q8QSE0_9HYPO|nr:Mitogen-activated protein kinase kinase [Purpureocillium takamizusanense]UNI23986.1 Mitogen-activated protein kinase kinase [Purpureocillium takamizusanense]